MEKTGTYRNKKSGTNWEPPRNMNETLAKEIAFLYLTLDRDAEKIGEKLGWGRRIDAWFLVHPMVLHELKRLIDDVKEREVYTLDKHIAQLERIRDAAFNDLNYKTALSAEIQVGKAAGLYEQLTPVDEGASALEAPEHLSTRQIRERLSKLNPQMLTSIPSPETAPAQYVPDEEADSF